MTIVIILRGQTKTLFEKGNCKMAKKPTVRPGQSVPDSGIYQSSISKTKSTMVKGEPAPPTKQKGEIWKQIVDTNPD